MILEYIHPTQISQAWDGIAPGIGAVRSKGGDHWRPEDVYMALKQGGSTLHIAKEGGEYVGFVVLTPTQGYDGPVLHVWLAYSCRPDIDVLGMGLNEIDKLANQMQARRLTFSSARKGWDRHGEKLGWNPILTVYEREVHQ